jgi:hypothetical protein
MEIVVDNSPNLGRGSGNPAITSVPHGSRSPRKRSRFGIAALCFELIEVDTGSIQPRRRSGLESPEFKPRPRKRFPKRGAWSFAKATAGTLFLAGVQQSAEKGAGCENDRASLEALPAREDHPEDAPFFDQQPDDLSLDQGHPAQPFDHPSDALLIHSLVTLRSWAPHRRAARPVESFELNSGAVRGPSLEAAEGIDLGHQVALADATDSRIARHLRDRSAIEGHQRYCRPHAGNRGGGFTARMPGTHDHDIESRHHYFPMQNEL